MPLENPLPTISKTKYIAGLQCQKLLWYLTNAKDLVPGPDARTQFIFDQGNAIGALARKRYPDGIDLTPIIDLDEVVSASYAALVHRKPLFEAGFRFRNAFARADIMLPVGDNEWDLIEVKSSTGLKKIHIADMAHQRYTYEGAGLKLRKCWLMHINTQYVRGNELNLEELFSLTDATEEVTELLPAIEGNVLRLTDATLLPEAPPVTVGKHCDIPNHCPMFKNCHAFLPEHNVLTLVRAGERAYKWISEGIYGINALAAYHKFSRLQQIQVAAVKSGKPHIDREAIAQFLTRLKYPLLLLDFETMSLAIPQFPGTSPYQAMPFQFSLHRIEAPGTVPEHFSYLSEADRDPRPEILFQLRQLMGDRGSVVAYNAQFEYGMLDRISQQFSAYRPWVKRMQSRMVDLLRPFQSFDYYHPEQYGSASIKAVLPAMTGRSYRELEISDGELASIEYVRSHFQPVAAEEREAVRQRLLAYCNLDTEAMIAILSELEEIVRGG